MKKVVLIIAVFFSVLFNTFLTSCTPEPLEDATENVATEGEDGEVDPDDDDGGSN